MAGLQSKFQILNAKVNQNVDRQTEGWTIDRQMDG